MEKSEFEQQISPFFWVEHDSSISLCLSIGSYKPDLFDSRADEGFLGNGYDWMSLAQVFINEKMPQISDAINFDPEADMFVAYAKSADADKLSSFAIGFKQACENEALIQDLLSRAELD